MAQIDGTVRQAGSVVKKIYRTLWLMTIIGFIVTLGGFYLELRKLTGQVARLESMVNTLGEQLVGADKWKEKAGSGLDKLKGQVEEQAGDVGDIIKKLGK